VQRIGWQPSLLSHVGALFEVKDRNMKRILFATSVAVVVCAGSALAQQSSDAPPSPAKTDVAPSSAAPQPPGPPGPGEHSGVGGNMGANWHRGPWGHRPPPPPSKAAHFRIEDGSVKIDVKCAEDEPMKACADELNQILKRLEGSSSTDEDDR
jgi:hypothetical protein